MSQMYLLNKHTNNTYTSWIHFNQTYLQRGIESFLSRDIVFRPILKTLLEELISELHNLKLHELEESVTAFLMK